MARIIGYRKDRLGARILTLINTIRITQSFLSSGDNLDFRYLWPLSLNDETVDIRDPEHAVFSDAFMSNYIKVLDDDMRPDFSDRVSVENLAGRFTTQALVREVQNGSFFYTQEHSERIFFMDELLADRPALFKRAHDFVEYHPRIQAALDAILKRIKANHETVHAVHIRRGDVISVDPWQHKHWRAKYVPMEFFEQATRNPNVSYLIFTDSDEIGQAYRDKSANFIVANDLVMSEGLTGVQRDLVELLLIANTERIICPQQSAFSMTPALISGMPIYKLPTALPERHRVFAYDRLLERVLKDKKSFLLPGDFAQSLAFASRHAIANNRSAELAHLFSTIVGTDYWRAFLIPQGLALAIATEDARLYERVHQTIAPLKNHIWPDDKRLIDGVIAVKNYLDSGKDTAPVPNVDKALKKQDLVAGFFDTFTQRTKSDRDLDCIFNFFLQSSEELYDFFMIDQIIYDSLEYIEKYKIPKLFGKTDNFLLNHLSQASPLWLIAVEWPEIFSATQLLKNISATPPLRIKLQEFPEPVLEAEKYFFDGGKFVADPDAISLFGLLASIFTLHGRFRRSSVILKKYIELRPTDPMGYKREANRLMAQGKPQGAIRNLNAALRHAPGHVGLLHAKALAYAKLEDFVEADKIMEEASLDSLFTGSMLENWERILRQKKDKKKRLNVLRRLQRKRPDDKSVKKKIQKLKENLN